MRTMTRGGLVLSLVPALAVLVVGCGSPTSGPAQGGGKKDKGEEAKHDTWWCDEHGIPEDECIMCSDKLKKEAKARGDWCDKHNRAKSQCFLCEPNLKEMYAAKFRAKYPGKEPPPITDP